MSSAFTRAMVRSSSSSETASTKSATASRPEALKLNTYLSPSRPSRIRSRVWACEESPANAITGSTSSTMLAACLAESVS